MKFQPQCHQLSNSIGNDIFNAVTYPYRDRFSIYDHFHKSYELIFCMRGTAKIKVFDTTYLLKEKEWALIRPYQLHSFHIAKDASVYITCFSQSYVRSFDKMMAGKEAQTPVFTCCDSTVDYFCEHFIQTFPCRFCPPTEMQALSVKACLYMVLHEYLSRVPLHDAKSPVRADSHVAMDILQYINEHFRENISIQSVAREIGYHPQYLSRIFNQTFGVSFRTLLNQYRYEYALQMLKETDADMTEVAFESGFQSIRSLNRVFLQLANATPTQIAGGGRRASQTKKTDET